MQSISMWLVFFFCLLATTFAVRGEDYYVLPYKPDPAITVDGRLDDWANVPNALVLDRAEQVSYGRDTWAGVEDLSATVRLAWREGGIYLAAEVTDDHVRQPYVGRNIWMGDHVNLWMDLTPGVDPQRSMFGEGQFHVVLSPGNFGGEAGGDQAIAPEIYVYRPEGLEQQGGEIVAVRTERGYLIEAYLPFSRLAMTSVAMFKDANFEVAISDADADPAKQESMITVGTAAWYYRRDRMLPMVFGDGNGKAPPPLRGMAIDTGKLIPPGETLELSFDAPAVPEGKEPFIFFRTRFHSAKPAGFRVGALALEVNNQLVEGTRIANRPMKSTITRGTEHTFVTPQGAVSVCYSPDYQAFDRDSTYALIDNTKACEYEFSLAGLLREGSNTVAFRNSVAKDETFDYTAHIDDVALRIRVKPPPPPPLRPAPDGEIPTVVPQKEFPRTYSNVSFSPAHVRLTVSGQSLSIASRYSTPDGQWNSASNSFFTVKRELIEHDEWIEVRDKFTNLTSEDLPLIQEHACALGEALRAAWVGGFEMPNAVGSRSSSDNPSVFATTDHGGIGMFPLNDVFLVHVAQSVADGTITIRDGDLYLKPGASYTAEFAIVPTTTPDFWAFINAARRLRGVNFPLRWCFAFMFHHWPVYEWSDQTIRNFIDFKGANFVVQSNTVRNKRGNYARVNDWIDADLSVYRDFQKRIRGLYGDGSVKTGIYYHCFLDTTIENNERFTADRALDSAGNHIDYGGTGSYMKYFIPLLEEGRWGEQMYKVLETILDDIGADGIFQDEFSYSRVENVYGHEDGTTADIDPRSFKLIRRRANVPLLSLPFREKVVDRVLGEGRPYIINGAPMTRTMVDKHFPAFTETGSMSNCRRMLLHSPIALGDHLTEHSYADSYANIHAALDQGCLFVWYSHIHTTHVTPTKYYYPFTPIELHSGFVIGEERIITNRSGYFGWGDSSNFEAHVFDREGKPTQEVTVPQVERDGRTFGEVRLPEGYMAILVRQR